MMQRGHDAIAGTLLYRISQRVGGWEKNKNDFCKGWEVIVFLGMASTRRLANTKKGILAIRIAASKRQEGMSRMTTNLRYQQS